MNLINVGKQLPSQPLTFIPCIINRHTINIWCYLKVWLMSDLMQDKVNICKYITVDTYGTCWLKNI